jgi:predicted GTPase
MKTRVIIMGAAGRDFHNFNVFFKNNPNYEIVAFTATQIPGIEGRIYPKKLAGKRYPKGIPIYPEEKLTELIKKYKVDEVVFSYSDVSHEYVMHKASTVLAAGADFALLGPNDTMLKSKKPVISVCATRTGAGKSPTSRKICEILRSRGLKVVVIRHPMPYGHLIKQACERFASYADLNKYETTIEEREEYEPHIDKGAIVYAGVDYEKILREAEKEADVIIWDGGNNDFPFIKPTLHIVVADARRAGHEIRYHPGETNLRMADIVIINKINSSKPGDVKIVEKNISETNPKAKVIHANLKIIPEKPEMIKNKRVLVIEDGPTLTHGELTTGAAFLAAKEYNAKEIVDPRKNAVGSIKDIYKKYTHLKIILPAMGYSKKQIKELEETINKTDCDLVIVGTPIDLRRLLEINKPAIRVRYEIEEIGRPNLEDVLDKF